MKYTRKLNEKGFTILELMIATLIFSVILLVTSVGVIAIGRAYYKSLTTTRVQETARSILEDVSRSVQFTGTLPEQAESGNIKVKCFGPDTYTYTLNQKVSGSNNGIYRDRLTELGCVPSDCFNRVNKSGCTGKELLGENMRVLRFDVGEAIAEGDDCFNESWCSKNGAPYVLGIKIAYGDNDLLNHYDDVGNEPPLTTDFANVQCKSGISGSNFCAVAQLETTVASRVK